jgi:uncharacterized protein
MPEIDLADPATPAAEVIRALRLAPHPEGGHYRETWRDAPSDGSRGAATAILFLLEGGEVSRWHRVDAAEFWIWQAGAPLRLQVSEDGKAVREIALAGQALHGLVPKHAWQSASSTGAWTLVTCVVAPAFRFEGFEMALPGWVPGG